MNLTSRGQKLAVAYLRSIRRKVARHVTEAEATALAVEVNSIVWERVQQKQLDREARCSEPQRKVRSKARATAEEARAAAEEAKAKVAS